MKNQLVKWVSVLALVSFVAAVFMIAEGWYWPGVACVVAGGGLSSAAAIYAKKQ